MIYSTLKLLKNKLNEALQSDLRQNYTRFITDANTHLDNELSRKEKEKFLKKKINTDFTEYSNEFISMIEGKHDPIYGIQFNIEKSFYNFHRNSTVKNNEITRTKDQLLAKFFLKKVFDEKIKTLSNNTQCMNNKQLNLHNATLLTNVANYIFSHQKLLPHLHIKQCGYFDHRLLCGQFINEKNPKTKKTFKVYSMNSQYNNNLSEQILRDYDDFYFQLYGNNATPLGIGQRFVMRSIGKESEVLIFKKVDSFELGNAVNYAQKK